MTNLIDQIMTGGAVKAKPKPAEKPKKEESGKSEGSAEKADPQPGIFIECHICHDNTMKFLYDCSDGKMYRCIRCETLMKQLK